MKKVILTVATLALTMALLAMSIAAVPVQKGKTVITGDAAVLLDGTTNTTLKGQDTADQQAFAVVDSGDKKLIEMTYKTDGSNAGLRVDLDGVVNADGKDYYEFWIDASWCKGDVLVGLRLYALDGSAADIYKSNDTVHFYYVNNNKWVEGVVSGNHVILPAGYSGYVRVDLGEYAANIPDYCGNGNLLKLNQICGLSIWVESQEGQNGKSVYFNDFRFVNGTVTGDALEDATDSNAYTADFTAVAVAISAIAVVGIAFASRKKH